MTIDKIDELELMAYVDGELDDESAREVETLLESSNEARELVKKMQSSAELIRKTYEPVLAAPAPQQLVNTIEEESTRSNVVRLDKFLVPKRWTAIAASLALGVIVGVAGMEGYYSGEQEGTQGEERRYKFRGASSENTNLVELREEFSIDLKQVLEETETGQEIKITLENGTVIIYTPLDISQSKKGLLCRDASYKVAESISTKDDVVKITACRDNEGKWRVVNLSDIHH